MKKILRKLYLYHALLVDTPLYLFFSFFFLFPHVSFHLIILLSVFLSKFRQGFGGLNHVI